MEDEIIAALNAKKNTYPVLQTAHIAIKRLPPAYTPKPETEVVVFKAGGATAVSGWQKNRGVIKTAFLIIHVYNNDRTKALAIASLICELLEDITTANIRYININEGPHQIDYDGREFLVYANADVML